MGMPDTSSLPTHASPAPKQGGSSPTNLPKNGQASIVEPRVDSRSAAEAITTDDMFLSPRVLDAGAFTRYSEMLKSIITQAGAQGRSLEDFSTDAQAMIKRCDVTSEAINKRMQAGLRMIKMIDERAGRTERLLEQVADAGPNTQKIADEIDQIIAQRLSDAQAKADEIAAQTEAKILEANTRFEATNAKAQEQIAASEGYALKLSELSSRVEQQLNELDARLTHTRDEANRTLSEIVEQTQQARNEMEQSLDSISAKAAQTGNTLAIKIDEASEFTQARINELNESIEPVTKAAAQAMRTLGMDPENPVFEDSPLARIEHLVERGETQSASLDRVYRQLEDLQSQAEGIKAVFGVWLVDAAEQLDVLEDRKEHIVGPMSAAADKINALAPDLDDNLELAATKLTHLQIEQQALRQTIQASTDVANEVAQRMTNESGQLQALLDGSLHKLSTRVEQAGVWLGSLIQRAESVASGMPGAGQMNFTPAPTPAPAPATTPAESVQASAPADPIPSSVNQPVVTPEASMIEAPQPPCLPIDALGFGTPID